MPVHDTSRKYAPSVISSRTSLFDNASRLRRLIRERLLNKISGSETSENEIPEYLSDEDLKEGGIEGGITDGDVSFTSFVPFIEGKADAEIGTLIPVGLDVEGGKRVNDGFISFIVPEGWVACRKEDCFYLIHGLSVGYVRSVPSPDAASALLETDRLQIVCGISARTSPEFASPRSIQLSRRKGDRVLGSPYMHIEYYSHFGMGKG